jgi:HNH endonuclease
MKCKFCDRVCLSAPSLRNHERLCHSNPRRQIPNTEKGRIAALIKVECSYCHQNFSKGGIGRHLLVCKSNPEVIKSLGKKCPICDTIFVSSAATCSYSCANKHFKTGKNNGNWKEDSYQSTCFESHKKECVICGETKIVAVHHLDHNHKNNDPENLIPMCPTHHQYWHSRYRELVEPKVRAYIENWKNNRLTNAINTV